MLYERLLRQAMRAGDFNKGVFTVMVKSGEV